ncbi:MAG: nicotinamide-nucleotide amidohydrolase family protein [Clostridia bacterium]|nr:nicotinamide-nucleotide amidohydrolase family protein [Clostridia bacterium]
MNCVRILVQDLDEWEVKLAHLKDAFPTLVTNVGGRYDKTLWWEMESLSEDSEAAAKVKIEELWGDGIYAHEDKPLGVLVAEKLREKGKHISVAESLTGGALSAELVRYPGATDVFYEGVVAYSNGAKAGRLGVDTALIVEKGAVSSEVAAAMAKGLLENDTCDIAVSTTGIAGPKGDGVCTTVGLTYIGVATKEKVQTYMHIFSGDREGVRRQAAAWALLHALRNI